VSALAPHLSAFFHERLPKERGASPNTCDAYAYAFKLLLQFAQKRLKRRPSALELEQVDAPLVTAFLNDLEAKRGCSPSTRNARLAAIKSFMRFVELRVPASVEQVARVIAIPTKITTNKLVRHLAFDEMEAILRAPDIATRAGIRDRAMIHLCFAGGLRVTELVSLPLTAFTLRGGPTIHVVGKGRKERVLYLWKEAAADVRSWLAVRGPSSSAEIFLNAHGSAMSRSGFEYVLEKHVKSARRACPSLKTKSVSPHVLRHTCAMTILQATGDLRKVSLWLGHSDMQTTQIYLRSDPTERLELAANTRVPALQKGRFRAPDKLIASLLAK
jgi:integrase/recombinase XerD